MRCDLIRCSVRVAGCSHRCSCERVWRMAVKKLCSSKCVQIWHRLDYFSHVVVASKDICHVLVSNATDVKCAVEEQQQSWAYLRCKRCQLAALQTVMDGGLRHTNGYTVNGCYTNLEKREIYSEKESEVISLEWGFESNTAAFIRVNLKVLT